MGNSVFDILMSEVNGLSLINTSKNHALLENIDYHCVISNDPLELSEIIGSADSLHMKTILLMHNSLPAFIKKEDKFLLSEAFKRTSICCMTENARKDSLSANSQYLSYGLPVQSINKGERQSILVLNPKHNSKISDAYNRLKDKYPDAKMITSFLKYSCSDIIDIFNQYSMVLAIDNYIDAMFAISCGCLCLTNVMINIQGIIPVSNFNNITEIIDSHIKKYNADDQQDIASYIQNQYNMDIFLTNMENFIRYSISG